MLDFAKNNVIFMVRSHQKEGAAESIQSQRNNKKKTEKSAAQMNEWCGANPVVHAGCTRSFV